ncbi:MAG: rod shape-determining protein RodA [Chthonomonadales bacterium]
MLETRMWKGLDWWLVLVAMGIAGMGLLAVTSATHTSAGHQYQKQALWLLLGLGGMAAAASVDCGRILRLARPLYVTNLILLALVFGLGHGAKGAQRWIALGSFQFQPSEFAKVCLILCLAAYLAARAEHLNKLSTLLGSLAYLGIPMLLIFKQPDLGTSLVVLAIWFGMAFVAGARPLHLALILMTGMLLFGAMWHFNVLKPYQKSRFIAFLDPKADPAGAGYQVRQSTIAIGSGDVWGRGFERGTQSQGKFIPENHTDFIFTVVGEEGGFVGALFLIALYTGLILRGAAAMAYAVDLQGRLVAAGIVCMIAFHVIVNVGMTMGIMPVTGVPLPLVSYGGSSLVLNLMAVGLLLSIGKQRHGLIF